MSSVFTPAASSVAASRYAKQTRNSNPQPQEASSLSEHKAAESTDTTHFTRNPAEQNFLKAIAKGRTSQVKKMLETGIVKADIQNKFDQTPMHQAAYYGQADMIRVLYKHLPQVNMFNAAGRTPMHNAAIHGNHAAIAQLHQFGAWANIADKGGNTPLHLAARGGYVETVRLLTSYPNVNVNAQNQEGNTSLHLAALYQNFGTVEKLLTLGADPDLRNKQGKPARAFIPESVLKKSLKKRQAIQEPVITPETKATQKPGAPDLKIQVPVTSPQPSVSPESSEDSDTIFFTPQSIPGEKSVFEFNTEKSTTPPTDFQEEPKENESLNNASHGSLESLDSAHQLKDINPKRSARRMIEQLLDEAPPKHRLNSQATPFYPRSIHPAFMVNRPTIRLRAPVQVIVLPVTHQMACKGDVNTLAKRLSQVKTNPMERDGYGQTPLHLAAFNGRLDAVRLLLETPVKPFTGFFATNNPFSKTFIPLGEEKEPVNINAQDRMGNTPLHHALFRQQWPTAQYLLSKGANSNIQNRDGLSAYQLLRSYL